MPNRSNRNTRIRRLEIEVQFQAWLGHERMLESLTEEQLHDVAKYHRYPDPMPEPLPKGASALDGLGRKTLLKRWEESEREVLRIIFEKDRKNDMGGPLSQS